MAEVRTVDDGQGEGCALVQHQRGAQADGVLQAGGLRSVHTVRKGSLACEGTLDTVRPQAAGRATCALGSASHRDETHGARSTELHQMAGCVHTLPVHLSSIHHADTDAQ